MTCQCGGIQEIEVVGENTAKVRSFVCSCRAVFGNIIDDDPKVTGARLKNLESSMRLKHDEMKGILR